MSELDPSPPADGRTVGAAVAPLLEAYGVEVVFGIPGVHNVELYRGLPGTGIRHVLARHEQGAGFMADGYARLSGRPGVCFVISGPGLTNIATPLGQAYSDSIPMVVFGAVRALADLGTQRGHLHEISDQLAVARPLTGGCETVLTAGALPDIVHRSFSDLGAKRPRPSFIEIPLDVLVEPIEDDWFARPMPEPREPQAAAVSQAADLLANAKRPVMLVGGGAVGASKSLRTLCDRHGIAVLPTIAGKGVISDQHPLSLGAHAAGPNNVGVASPSRRDPRDRNRTRAYRLLAAVAARQRPIDSSRPGPREADR